MRFSARPDIPATRSGFATHPHRFLIACLMLITLLAPLSAARAGSAEDQVDRLNQVLIRSMQAGAEAGFQGRYNLLEPELTTIFDFPGMVRVALARQWPTMTAEDQTAVTAAFQRMSVSTFAARFDDFKGESIAIAGTRPGPSGLQVVRTDLTRADGSQVELTYVLRAGAGDAPARIIDVLAEGRYSELARQRAELTAVFARGGAAALVESLSEKADALAAGKTDG